MPKTQMIARQGLAYRNILSRFGLCQRGFVRRLAPSRSRRGRPGSGYGLLDSVPR